jgi:hypothetical protein
MKFNFLIKKFIFIIRKNQAKPAIKAKVLAVVLFSSFIQLESEFKLSPLLRKQGEISGSGPSHPCEQPDRQDEEKGLYHY